MRHDKKPRNIKRLAISPFLALLMLAMAAAATLTAEEQTLTDTLLTCAGPLIVSAIALYATGCHGNEVRGLPLAAIATILSIAFTITATILHLTGTH